MAVLGADLVKLRGADREIDARGADRLIRGADRPILGERAIRGADRIADRPLRTADRPPLRPRWASTSVGYADRASITATALARILIRMIHLPFLRRASMRRAESSGKPGASPRSDLPPRKSLAQATATIRLTFWRNGFRDQTRGPTAMKIVSDIKLKRKRGPIAANWMGFARIARSAGRPSRQPRSGTFQ